MTSVDARLDATAPEAARSEPLAREYKGECRECGAVYAHARRGGGFCSADCRRAWNNRRAVRGAEIYDLVMALRFDRRVATALKLWRIICRMAAEYRSEDMERRDGRPSWRDPRQVLGDRPYLHATVLSRNVGGRRS